MKARKFQLIEMNTQANFSPTLTLLLDRKKYKNQEINWRQYSSYFKKQIHHIIKYGASDIGGKHIDFASCNKWQRLELNLETIHFCLHINRVFFCVRIDVFIFTLYYSYNVSDVWKAFNCEKKVSVLANHQGFSIIRFYPQFGLVSFLIRFTIK